MSDDIPDSPFFAIAPLEPEWQQILHSENQIVLYNPTSHALSIQQHEATPRTAPVVRRNRGQCPYCHRPMPRSGPLDEEEEAVLENLEADEDFHTHRSRAPDYFQLLQIATETGSVPSTPASSRRSPTPTLFRAESSGTEDDHPFQAGNMAEGYFKTFFQEECRLGMGANGSVYLCQVSRSCLMRSSHNDNHHAS